MSGIVRSRPTIRRNPPDNRTPKYIEPWTFAEAKENSTLAKIEAAFFTALEAVDQIEDTKAKARQSGAFTDEGVLANALEFAATKLSPRLKRARLIVERAREELAAKRAKLVLKPSDKTDAAGQMRRLYKLDKFNALPDSERNAYVAKGNLDAELVQAFLEMPDYAKLLPSDLEQLRDSVLRADHGDDAVNELADLAIAVATADLALTAAREEVAQEVGGVQKLDEAAAPFEQALGVLWLKKDTGVDGTEAVKVFKQTSPTSGIWANATPQEREAGQFFKDYNEWHAAGGVWPIAERKSNVA
jgi:hypothetical protein